MDSKFIFISGGVISGIGKGITSASISLLLKSAGYRVAPMKFENYLNLDSGTINPIEHGDPFLCEDGTEADMDIGTYEKFLNEDMGRANFVTMGQIYQTVIDRERRFEYKGEDVEAIPHITDEVISRIRTLAHEKQAEIVLIELGGTAGEYQNSLYYEAARLMSLQSPGDVIHIHVSYVPTPGHLGEPKTKPTQLSVRTLNSMGIQPDFIVARCDKPLDERRKERLAMFCSVPKDHVISNPDVESVYEIPLVMREQNLHTLIFRRLQLPEREPAMDEWEAMVAKAKEMSKSKDKVEIAIVGKYFGTGDYQIRDSYAALIDAIDHACVASGVRVKTRWVDAEKVEKLGAEEVIGKPDGIIVPIGWGSRGSEGMIAAASYARTQKIPYLGLCYGMQLAVVAFARDVLGLKEANTCENDTSCKDPVIHLIPGQKELLERRAYGGTMRLGTWDAEVKHNTRVYEWYKQAGQMTDAEKGLTSERHRHRYEFNDAYADVLEEKGLVIAARSVVEHLAEIIELPEAIHPFYVGTQGHPEYKSRPLRPHPLFVAFLQGCAKAKGLV